MYLPLVAILGDTADGFDRAVPLWHALEGVFDDDVGFAEGLRDIAALDFHGHGDVSSFIVVDQRRAVLHRFFGVEDGQAAAPNRLRSGR